MIDRPRLVILDELTQGLDPAARRGVWNAISGLRGDGTSVLLVTHELDEAEQLCDRVVAMRAGRVVDAGSPSALVDRHGGWAQITFTMTSDTGSAEPADRLSALPGVAAVRIEAQRVTIDGTRASIAHVGAALVGKGPVPADLSVRVPTLEDALVGLLERQVVDASPGPPIGAEGTLQLQASGPGR